MKNKKIFVIGLILLLAVFFIVRAGRGPAQTRYEFARVAYGNVVELVSASGNVLPGATVEVFPSINGKIAKVYAANGDEVALGDNLFKINNPATGQEDIVTAPAGGTVTNLSIAEGARVATAPASGGASGGGNSTPVLLIVDLSSYSIKLQINEVYISKIKTGQKATVDFDAVVAKAADAEVDRVDEIGTNTQGVITYNVYLTLDDTPENLRPMMTANIDIETAERRHVLTLPNSALVPFRGGKAVRVLDKKTGRVRSLPVKIGVAGTLRSEIVGGVKNGRQVITGTSASAPRGLLPFGGSD